MRRCVMSCGGVRVGTYAGGDVLSKVLDLAGDGRSDRVHLCPEELLGPASGAVAPGQHGGTFAVTLSHRGPIRHAMGRERDASHPSSSLQTWEDRYELCRPRPAETKSGV